MKIPAWLRFEDDTDEDELDNLLSIMLASVCMAVIFYGIASVINWMVRG